MQRTANSSWCCAVGQRSAFFILVLVACGRLSVADDYSWVGGSQSWTDPMNWLNPNETPTASYPDGDDNVVFSHAAAVSLNGNQSAYNVDIKSGNVSFASGSLQVNGFNLFRVGAGGQGSLDLLSGGNVNANGTLAGVDATGTIWVYNGSTLSDSNEISIGYTNTGRLNLVDGGTASSSGAVFIGGFANGDGDVMVSDAGSKLSGTSFIVVGNLGHGMLAADSGGEISSAGNLFIGGFASGIGQVVLMDANTKLQAAQQLEIGSSGTGSLDIGLGAVATAKSVLIGAAAGSHGDANVHQQGSKLEVTAGALSIGNLGQGTLHISEGGAVNVQGAGSFAILGSESTGVGTLEIDGQGSKLTVSNNKLEIGRFGQGTLQVSDHGTVDTHGLEVGSGNNTQSSATISGSGTLVDAHEEVRVGTFGNGRLEVNQSARLNSQSGFIGEEGEGIVTITGSGSIWDASSIVFVGSSGTGSLDVLSAGKLKASALFIGVSSNGDGTFTLDGADSKLETELVVIGGAGHGEFKLQHGASFSFAQAYTGVEEGELSVQDAGSIAKLQSVLLGSASQSRHGDLLVNTNGKVQINADLDIQAGTLDVGSGGTVTIGGSIQAGISAQSNGQILVRGAGSKLDTTGTITLGSKGDATLHVEGGGSVTAHQIVETGNANDTDAYTDVHILGLGTSVTADSLTLIKHNAILDVGGGAALKLSQSLNLHAAHLTLSNSNIDIGNVPPPIFELNFVRVGTGGSFSADTPVPNVHKFGGEVHVGGSPGTLTVTGAYIQDEGATSFSITGTQAGSEYSQLVVGGNLQLSGTLVFNFESGFAPQAGQTFDLITVGGTSQLNSLQIQVKNVAPSFQYTFAPFPGGYRLTALTNALYAPDVPGDLNGDGVVDARDYVVWRNYVGTRFTQADYDTWRAHFGQTAGSGAALNTLVAVPEPNAGVAMSLMVLVLVARRRSLVATGRLN